ncbi:PrsW family intramembrane metalloprotease [Cryobacterium sp. SO2]|uniref:PrsW family intramembrane metalloprotease n=1 Tax=Cryobacterium sp. SO2 TaxID=1897060 RepID=UPI00223E6E28|nr:PrsW family intramembrane metalloprotease [Cryobacterium sp. SO2]WEO78566.1 PrsW family intramembrane metalloprotease [Cryobacterium sp. SO2]
MTLDPTGRSIAVPAQDAPIQSPVWSAPVRRTRLSTVVWASVGIVVAALAVILVLVYLSTFLGAGALLVCLLLALVPLTLVILAVRWIDRWEPEPRPALWFAFLWGAGVSIVTALVFDLGVQIVVATSGTARPAGDFLTAVVQAPLVEESAKGFGLLLLFWVIRGQFNGPIDGVVYAAMIAAGFAFSENIQYFGVAMLDGGIATLGVTFLLRGVLSPFAHVLFTACTGLAVGLAARRATGSRYIGTVLIGLAAAVLLHAVWNGAFYFLTTDASLVGYYFLVQFPMFLGAIITMVMLRRQEERLTVQRLGDYAAVGWFTAAEVDMLATPRGRRQARAWAHAQPPARRMAMNRFIVDATRLASVRQRLVSAQAHPSRSTAESHRTEPSADQAEEARLLGLLMADRAEVIG